MLKILQTVVAIAFAILGIYFGVLGSGNIFKYFGKKTEEKIRGAKLRATYFSLCTIGCLVALSIYLSNLLYLLLLLVVVGGLWLDYLIYRSVNLWIGRKTR